MACSTLASSLSSAFTGRNLEMTLPAAAANCPGAISVWAARANSSSPSSSAGAGSNGQQEPPAAWPRPIEGLSMMQSRGPNSRRWIVPGTHGGPDGFTFRALTKKEKDVPMEAADFTVDLSKMKSNSRRWSAVRAEASRTIRSSGWRAPKVDLTRTDATNGAAPINFDASAELVKRISAMTPGIGGFGGLYPQGDSYLVASTAGVGLKLKLAFETGIHDTMGVDLVAMAVNDIVTSGAEPLFFLDYFATGNLDVDIAEKVIHGIVEGCRMSNCALLGGETAEMPGFYPEGTYDLSGFVVGKVHKDKLIDGTKIEPGDVIVGFQAESVHTDGYAAIHLGLEKSGMSFEDKLPGCPMGLTIGEAVMQPTDIYVPEALALAKAGGVKAVCHIAGGGYTETIPKMFPPGLCGSVREDAWVVPPIFKWLKKATGLPDDDMYSTFNMGIGMVFVLDPHAAHRLLSGEARIGKAYRLGEVKEGSKTRFHNAAHAIYY